MIFDFRHKDVEGHWHSSGHCKGPDRDAAFEILEQKSGGMPAGRYMSRPRDGRAKNWDLFSWPKAAASAAEPVQPAALSDRSD